jgi:hypothetical protein
MRYLFSFFMTLSVFTVIPIIGSAVDQKLDNKLNQLQQSIAIIIQQSNLDPLAAQELIDQTNDLNQYLQNNIQQDIVEIRAAAAISSALESVDKIAQAKNLTDLHTWLSSFKLAARANVIHKLLIGMYPGQFKDEEYYTNPYLESIGFISNDWILDTLFSKIFTTLAASSLGTTLQLNPSLVWQKVALKIIAGLSAHYAWLFEKKILLSQQSLQ